MDPFNTPDRARNIGKSTWLTSLRSAAIREAKRTQQSLAASTIDNPQTLNSYRFEKFIGKGSYGRVYKAAEVHSGTLVAIKIIDVEQGDCRYMRAHTITDVAREASTLRTLSSYRGSSNINTLLDVFTAGSSVCIVTHFCAGGSVERLMKPLGCVPETFLVAILREVAVAINWIHSKGVIHRDIKCANVLVTGTGAIRLCDFGVAAELESDDATKGSFAGTLHWMAPEMFSATARYGKEVDVWAFGSLAYEAATGKAPNVEIRDVRLLGQQLRVSPPKLEGCYSFRLRSLIERCMECNREKRPSMNQILAHPYLVNTERTHPTSSLVEFVQMGENLEDQNLLDQHGAQRAKTVKEEVVGEWRFEDPGEILRQVTDYQDGGSSYAAGNFEHLLQRRGVHPLEKLFQVDTTVCYEEYAQLYYQDAAIQHGPKRHSDSFIIHEDDDAENQVGQDNTVDNAVLRTITWQFQNLPAEPGNSPRTPTTIPVSYGIGFDGEDINRQPDGSLIDLDEAIRGFSATDLFSPSTAAVFAPLEGEACANWHHAEALRQLEGATRRVPLTPVPPYEEWVEEFHLRVQQKGGEQLQAILLHHRRPSTPTRPPHDACSRKLIRRVKSFSASRTPALFAVDVQQVARPPGEGDELDVLANCDDRPPPHIPDG